MLEKNTKYFTGLDSINLLSKFMLIDFDILPEKQAEIPGVVHANGTSRIQTLFSRTENPFMFDLLTLLDTNYNVKALINTSFNIQGKPIAHTQNDALNYAKQMELDTVVFNGHIINF
jgi:carbamoyltransferase